MHYTELIKSSYSKTRSERIFLWTIRGHFNGSCIQIAMFHCIVLTGVKSGSCFFGFPLGESCGTGTYCYLALVRCHLWPEAIPKSNVRILQATDSSGRSFTTIIILSEVKLCLLTETIHIAFSPLLLYCGSLVEDEITAVLCHLTLIQFIYIPPIHYTNHLKAEGSNYVVRSRPYRII